MKTKLGTMAANTFSNYTKKEKENATALYGTDENGNPNFVEMGKDLYRDNLRSATNVKDYDITKELDNLAKAVGNTTTQNRGKDGTMFLNTNTGDAGAMTYDKAKRVFAAKLDSPIFAETFNKIYGSQIKTDDLKNKPIDEAKGIALERAIELGAKTIMDFKDAKKEAVARLEPKITVNNYAAEVGGHMQDFLDRVQYDDSVISNSAANELLGKNQTLGTEIRSVKIESKDASGKNDPKGQKGIGISYISGKDDNNKPLYEYKFIPFDAEHESELASLWQGSASYGRRKGDENKGVVRPAELDKKLPPPPSAKETKKETKKETEQTSNWKNW